MDQELNKQEPEINNKSDKLLHANNFEFPATIPIIEEQVHITKEVIESGKLKISKQVREVEEIFNMPISYEDHEVKRISLNKVVEGVAPTIRYEGDTVIIPVVREELVVQKRLVLIEEVHVTRHQASKMIQQSVTLLKEELVVEHLPNQNPVFPNDIPTGIQPST